MDNWLPATPPKGVRRFTLTMMSAIAANVQAINRPIRAGVNRDRKIMGTLFNSLNIVPPYRTMEHMADIETLRMRFTSYTLEENERGCKLWNQSSDWYGSFRWGDRTIKAHRAAYMLFVGEIPEGKQVCHTCDVKNCVNPDHLFIGTQKDNIADMHSKGRWRSGNYGDHLKLSQAMADVIYFDERKQEEIARDYGISRCLVSGIKNNRVWRDRLSLTDEEKTRFKKMAERFNNELFALNNT